MTGEQFKAARETLGLSQAQLAEVLGLSGKQAVSNIETGFRNAGNLAAAVLKVLVLLPKKRSDELQTLLISSMGGFRDKKRRSK